MDEGEADPLFCVERLDQQLDTLLGTFRALLCTCNLQFPESATRATPQRKTQRRHCTHRRRHNSRMLNEAAPASILAPGGTKASADEAAEDVKKAAAIVYKLFNDPGEWAKLLPPCQLLAGVEAVQLAIPRAARPEAWGGVLGWSGGGRLCACVRARARARVCVMVMVVVVVVVVVVVHVYARVWRGCGVLGARSVLPDTLTASPCGCAGLVAETFSPAGQKLVGGPASMELHTESVARFYASVEGGGATLISSLINACSQALENLNLQNGNEGDPPLHVWVCYTKAVSWRPFLYRWWPAPPARLAPGLESRAAH